MTTAVLFGITGYAGCHIARELLSRGVDVVGVAVPSGPVDGKKLIDALPTLLSTLKENGARLGIVGGAGSLHVAPGGP